MAGYSELLQTMAAMLVFSLILLSANSIINRNDLMQVEGEMENATIAIAQNIIDEALIKEFDEESIDFVPVNIPGDFTGSANLGPDTGENNRSDFDDFDDYDGYTTTIDAEQGANAFNVAVQVFYIEEGTHNMTTSRTAFKKIEVTVTTAFLTDNTSNDKKEYKFEFIRNYYAD